MGRRLSVEQDLARAAADILAKFVINTLQGALRKRHLAITTCPVSPQAVGFLSQLVACNLLTKRQMKDLVTKWLDDAINLDEQTRSQD